MKIKCVNLKTIVISLVLILLVSLSSFAVEDNSSNLTQDLLFDLILNPTKYYNFTELNNTISINETTNVTKIKPKLAEVINGKNVLKDKSAKNYLKKYDNFDNMTFKEMDKKVKLEFKQTRDKLKEIKGITSDNKNFAIDIVYCNKREDYCNVRINGVLFLHLKEDSTVEIDSNHTMSVKKLKLNQCDKAVCDLLNDKYDLIDFEISKNKKFFGIENSTNISINKRDDKK